MELPLYLKNAIEEEFSNVKLSNISSAREKLTNDYRNKENRPKRFINSEYEILAYIGSRLPATYGVFCKILDEASAFISENTFDSLLDIGSGPGTVMYAVSENINDIKDITLLERDKFLIEKGKKLSAKSSNESVRKAKWINKELQELDESQKYDIVTVSYVLNELDSKSKEKLIDNIWKKSNKMIILVEPGTPEGFKNIRAARERLIKSGAKIIAPCPSENPCPIQENDWCHFSQRIERGRYQRYLKDAEESYEDEKFSYIVATKSDIEKDVSRIIRHPQIHKGHIDLNLCTSEGLKNITLSKKDNESYKKAKKLKWGDNLADI